MRKLAFIISILLISTISLQCLGALPRGAITDGADFRPVYANPTPGQFPITAMRSYDQDHISESWFKMIRESGANIAIGYLWTPDSIRKAFRIAEKTGLKLLMDGPQIRDVNGVAGIVRQFRRQKALAGYFMGDEPKASQFGRMKEIRNIIYSLDTTKIVYANLLPEVPPSVCETPTYTDYLEQAVKIIDMPLISFDNYPVQQINGNTIVRETFYSNLQTVYEVCKASHRPFWAFALVLAHFRYPEATEAHLRYEVFNALAYGAQGITYWRFMFENIGDLKSATIAPVTYDGSTTAVYDRMKVINAEIQSLTDVFLGCSIKRLGHIGNIPKDCYKLKKLPAPLKKISPQGEGVLVSYLSNRNQDYIVIVNHDLNHSQTVKLKWRKAVKRVLSNERIISDNSETLNLPAAGYAIYTY